MGANDKLAATFHPDPTPYACENCGKRWATTTVADDCCGPWLGDLDEDYRGYN